MNGRGIVWGEIRKNALARRDDDGSLSHFFDCVRFTTNLLHIQQHIVNVYGAYI